MSNPLVGILMGSKSDWDVMKHVSETLEKFGEIRHPKSPFKSSANF